MDAAFEITDPPRDLPSGISAEVPLITLAWRAMRAEHQHRAAELRDSEHEARKTQETLASVAEEASRLRSAGAGQPVIEQIARRLEVILNEAGISAFAPQGEPFTSELMELFDNIAQRPEVGLACAYVAEIVRPAILCRGAVLRMGKAIVAVPARDE